MLDIFQGVYRGRGAGAFVGHAPTVVVEGGFDDLLEHLRQNHLHVIEGLSPLFLDLPFFLLFVVPSLLFL